MQNKIKVLVVEDSPVLQRWLVNMIDNSPMMEVVETAADGIYVNQKVKVYRPDVITMDIEMPKMNGITALKNLMLTYPSRVLIISAISKPNADVTLQALRLGALDFVPKPQNITRAQLDELERIILDKIIAISKVEPKQIQYQKRIKRSVIPKKEEYVDSPPESEKKLVLIGASTGGPMAIEEILMHLPKNFPFPVVIAQHLPPLFSLSLAENLSYHTKLNVKEIKDLEYLENSVIYIAPGGFNIQLKSDYKGIFAKVKRATEDYGNLTPCIDEFFISAAKIAGKDIIACLLSGMGSDGSIGLKAIKQSGGVTIAQDKETALVSTMPFNAIKTGAVEKVFSLKEISLFLSKQIYVNN